MAVSGSSLRFFSQALGYEVYWDEGARTAVGLDGLGLAVIVHLSAQGLQDGPHGDHGAAVDDRGGSVIDEGFTILNDLQAKQRQTLEGDLAIAMDFSGEAKLLDSINGDKALPFSASVRPRMGARAGICIHMDSP